MPENEFERKPKRLSFDDLMQRIKWPFNRFYLFLLIAVGFALLMGLVSYRIYQLSDAASLDLSRPGYEKVQTEAVANKDEPVISPLGQIDQGFVHKIIGATDYYRSRVGEAMPFSNEPLLDENLINSVVSNE